MKFSYTTLLDYPLADSLEHIKTADELATTRLAADETCWDSGSCTPGRRQDEERPRAEPLASTCASRPSSPGARYPRRVTGGRRGHLLRKLRHAQQYGVDWKAIKPFPVSRAHE
jgi:hypothetical protein